MSNNEKGETTGGSATHSAITVTDANFEDLVLKSDTPVIVDFWAGWCRPCVALAPSMELLAAEFAGKLIVAKLDVEANTQSMEKYQVQGLPSLLFFHKGDLVQRHVGAAPRADLRIAFEKFLTERGVLQQSLAPKAQAALDEAIAAAEAHKAQQLAAAFQEFTVRVPAFREFDAVRIAFLKAIAPDLPPEQSKIAARGAAGEFDEEVYGLFVETRGRIEEEERFADLAQRQQATIEEVNSDENRRHSQEHMAKVMAADEEYSATIEAARKRIQETHEAA